MYEACNQPKERVEDSLLRQLQGVVKHVLVLDALLPRRVPAARSLRRHLLGDGSDNLEVVAR